MEICWLCFQFAREEETFNNSAVEDALNSLQEIISVNNQVITKTQTICESCVNSVQTTRDLISRIKITEQKIIETIKEKNIDKTDINMLSKEVNDLAPEMKQIVTVCRLCLNIIPQIKLWLCKNDTNILHYEILQNMLEFCNVSVNLKLTEKPAMCLKCWEHLQVAYTLKKNYIEIDKHIRSYSQKYPMRNRNINKDILIKIKQFLIKEKNQSPDVSGKIYIGQYNVDIARINFEHNYINPNKMNRDVSLKALQKKQDTFSKKEDQALLKSYFKVTNNEQNFVMGYWKKIMCLWLKLTSHKSIPLCKLQNRLSVLLRDKSFREEVNKIRTIVIVEHDALSSSQSSIIPNDPMKHNINKLQKMQEQRRPNTFSNNGLGLGVSCKESNICRSGLIIKDEPQSDSDDTFTEEASKSSFIPHVKTEPLSDNDSEIDVVETQKESYLDPLPQLERMDIPPMTIKIDKIYSLDEKRTVLNSLPNDMDLDPNIEVEEVKTCRKFSFKNQREEGLFKCLSCNFETKTRRSADYHSRWHTKGKNAKKIYKCQICPYKISNKKLLQIHERLHRAEDEIPVLLPMCIL